MQPLNREQAIKAYTELARLISVGAYDEIEPDGSYREGGDDVLKDIDRLEWRAYREGLKFVKGESGSFTLEPMTEEEKQEYLNAVMQEEEQSADDFISGRKRSTAMNAWLASHVEEREAAIEPVMRECPYCHQQHYSHQVEQCPLKPRH